MAKPRARKPAAPKQSAAKQSAAKQSAPKQSAPKKQQPAKKPAAAKARPAKAAKAAKAKPGVLEPVVVIGATGLRQPSFISAIAISPDGSHIATGDRDGHVRVFERATSACIFEAKWHARDHRGRHGIQRLAFSPDGAVITALTGINGKGNLCAAHLASRTTWFETATSYDSCAYSPDGGQIAAVRWGHVEIVNARDGTATTELALPENVHPHVLAWSPDGTRIVVSFYDNEKSTTTSLLVLDGASYEVLGMYDLGVDLAGSRLTFLPDGRVVTIVDDDPRTPAPRVVRFDPATGAHDDRPIVGEYARFPSYSLLAARGEVIYVNDGVATVIDLATARVVRSLVGDTRHGAATADGTLVVTSHGVTARVWDREWREVSAAPGLSTRVGAIAFTPDGQRIVTGDRTSIRTWTLGGAPISSLDVGDVATLAPDVSCAMVVQDDQTFVVDLPSGTRRAGELAEDLGNSTCSPDGRLVVRGRYPEGKLELWSLPTGKLVRSVDISGKSLYGRAFSPDGTLVAGGSWEGAIRVFAVATGEQLTDIFFRNSWGQVALSFTRDNQLLASGDMGRTVRLWKLPSGKLLHQLDGHRRKVIQVTAFSPDGNLLASADEADLRIWDVRRGKQLAVARVGATSLAFSPDGARLAAGGDGAAYLFDVAALA